MDGDPKDVTRDSEEPKVFRIAQIDAPGGSKMDRRKFVKATVAGVGAAAAAGVLGGCVTTSSDDADEAPAEIDVEEPAEPVEEEAPFEEEEPEEEEPSDEESTTVGGCACDSVCTCEAVCSCVGNCTCDSVSSGGSHYWYPS